jgi:hypothetical protein
MKDEREADEVYGLGNAGIPDEFILFVQWRERLSAFG